MARSKNSKKKSEGSSLAVEGSSDSHEKLECLIEEAEAAIDTFNYDEAQSKLKEILEIDKENIKCLEMLSGVHIEKCEWKEAQDLLKQCIDLEPEAGFSKYFSIAQLYEGLESVLYYEKGIQILEKQLENSENIEPSKEVTTGTLQRNLSDAYCSISEIFMTDCCFEDDAEEKCRRAIDLSIKSDPSNPESYQCLSNFQMVKGEIEAAKESIQKSLSLWLPHYEAVKNGESGLDPEKENSIPVYDSRVKTSQILIELEMFHEASNILEGLLEEDDEVVLVWYLLGWLNYQLKDDEHMFNAHFHLRKAKQVSVKLGQEDDCVDHIDELLRVLDSTHPIVEDDRDSSDSDFATEDEMET